MDRGKSSSIEAERRGQIPAEIYREMHHRPGNQQFGIRTRYSAIPQLAAFIEKKKRFLTAIYIWTVPRCTSGVTKPIARALNSVDLTISVVNHWLYGVLYIALSTFMFAFGTIRHPGIICCCKID